jgi:hypothetical protein
MGNIPIKVELVGLLPEFYRLCTKCQPMDYLGAAGVDYIGDQMSDYPEPILTEQKKLADLYYRLSEDFGNRVRLVPVELTSLRGVWLSLRHRLKNAPSLVIEGKRIVHGQLAYEEIKRAVQEELDQTQSGRRWN